MSQIYILMLVLLLPLFSQGQGVSTSETQKESTKVPNFVTSYSYYKYGMEGANSAETSIYRFGNASVDLHVLALTWLYSPTTTFVAVLPHLKNTIETIYEPTSTGMNLSLTDSTEGFGDVRLMMLKPWLVSGGHLLLYDISLTVPTGSIDEYFQSNPSQRAAYNMQLGSGTFDLIGGLSYNYNLSRWNFGGKGEYTARMGENNNDYALGNDFKTEAYSKFQVHKYFQAVARFQYHWRGALKGRDAQYEIFNKYVSGSIAGDGHQFYHGSQVYWNGSIIGQSAIPLTKQVTLNLEAGLPLIQELKNRDNIQLEINHWVSASLSALF